MATNADQQKGLIQRCRELLQERWSAVTAPGPPAPSPDVPEAIAQAVARSIDSKTKSYRYVLPTQILAKAADGELDCRSVQAGSGLTKSFDARSICQEVIVPFERANHNVLGGSPEPYANNPLRIASITQQHCAAQKNQAGFNDLRTVLDFAQDHPELVHDLLDVVLYAVRDRLARVAVTYPVPNRLSLRQTLDIVDRFLSARTGGLRLQVVGIALFRRIGEQFHLFDRVAAGAINAADASTGSAADLECLDARGNVLLAVEIKDRQLTLRHMQDKLPRAREKGIGELIFLVQGGIVPAESTQVQDLTTREFVTGQNIYVCESASFMESCLILFGETGRCAFVRYVGEELDRLKADLQHRQAWQQLLASI